MNTNNNFRDSTSSCKIVSKYFSNSPVMDKSSKQIIKDKQSTTKKPQLEYNKTQKRRTKTVAGQKDIRTLVKAKKSELLKYTKDFDLICKQSGIDVDPEQVQLAIALSKSLQDNKSTDNDGSNVEKSLTCNQRRSKIRRTLQEYGFQTKKPPGKKVKRYRKQYKLILLSDTEKQQRIAEKFTEILISNVFMCIGNVESLPKNLIDSNLYNLTTNVEYNDIKDDENFHINDLVPKTVDKYCTNNNFKDWSKIPGRPISPKLEELKHSFKDIECTQKELDDILSGPIDIAQNIVKRNYTNNNLKLMQSENTSTKVEINQESSIESELKSKRDLVGVFCENKSITDCRTLNISFNNIQTMALPINRSCSPDLFDDEVTIIMDSSKDKISMPEGISERTMTVKDDFMDLTNCIGNKNTNYIDSKNIACFSQGSNKTRSKSNDFMDLTECIPACSQKISQPVQNIGNLDKPNNCEAINKDGHAINQLSNFTYNYKPESGGNENSLDDTIIMIDEDYNNINHGNKNNITNSTFKPSVIIDLVGAQYESPTILNVMPKSNESIVDLEENPEACDNSYLEKYYPYKNPDNGSLTTIPNSAKDEGTIDLTQPANFKDCINTCDIPTALNSISNNAVDPSKIKDAIEIQKDDKLEKCDVEEMDLTQSSNSEDFLQEVSSEASTNKVQNANESREENCESSEKLKNSDGLDLTQSSNSEVCYEEMNGDEPSINNRSLEDTGTLNKKQYNSINLVTDELGGNDDLNCLDLYSNQQDKHYRHSIDAQKSPNAKINTINHVPITYDMNNDSEFDNLVKNVCNTKPRSSDLNDKKHLSGYSNLLDTAENGPYYQEIDLTQNYDCSPYKWSESKSLSDKSLNMDDDAHSIYSVINNDSIEVEIENEKNSSKWDEDLEMPEVVTKCSEANENQRKFGIDIDSNTEIDNVRRDSSDTIQFEYKDKNIIQLENSLHEDDHDDQNCDIDLTQQSDCSSDKSCSPKIIEVPQELGQRNNISIDYDDVCGNTDFTKECEITSLNINKYEGYDRSDSKDEGASGLSQNSEVFELSDNEFNYSIHHHQQGNESLKLEPNNFDIGGISVIDDFLYRRSLAARNNLRCSCSSNSDSNTNDKTIENCLPVVGTGNILGNNIRKESKSCEEVKIIKTTTPLKARSDQNILIAKTPKNDDYIIKTDQVTPMPNYENMTSPERNEELDNFGIKPLKRKRGSKQAYSTTHPLPPMTTVTTPNTTERDTDMILTHIYNQTHPVMEVISNDEYASPSKIRRKNNVESFPRRVVATQFDTEMVENSGELSSQTSQTLQNKPKERKRLAKDCQKSPKKFSSNENILYEETTLTPDIRNIECSSEDWVFQKREKAKVHSCRVPLHIAFHNYVSSRKALREAILRYEPINIDDIHKGLVAMGYRYNPKDLLKFMDRKCITVKTADNSKKNKNP